MKTRLGGSHVSFPLKKNLNFYSAVRRTTAVMQLPCIMIRYEWFDDQLAMGSIGIRYYILEDRWGMYCGRPVSKF